MYIFDFSFCDFFSLTPPIKHKHTHTQHTTYNTQHTTHTHTTHNTQHTTQHLLTHKTIQIQALQAQVEAAKHKVITPFISLETPGKATVQVIILADPVQCTGRFREPFAFSPFSVEAFAIIVVVVVVALCVCVCVCVCVCLLKKLGSKKWERLCVCVIVKFKIPPFLLSLNHLHSSKDGYEICFVGDEGFRDLAKIDPNGTKLLQDAIADDTSDAYYKAREQKRQAKQIAANAAANAAAVAATLTASVLASGMAIAQLDSNG